MEVDHDNHDDSSPPRRAVLGEQWVEPGGPSRWASRTKRGRSLRKGREDPLDSVRGATAVPAEFLPAPRRGAPELETRLAHGAGVDRQHHDWIVRPEPIPFKKQGPVFLGFPP